MKIEVEIDDNEILEMAKEKASNELAKRLFSFLAMGVWQDNVSMM